MSDPKSYDFSNAVQEKIIPKLDLTPTGDRFYDYFIEYVAHTMPKTFTKIVKLCDAVLESDLGNDEESMAATFDKLGTGNGNLRVLVTALAIFDKFKQKAVNAENPFSCIQEATAPVTYENAQNVAIQVSMKDFGTNGPHSGYKKLVKLGFNPEEIRFAVHNALKSLRSAMFKAARMPEESHL